MITITMIFTALIRVVTMIATMTVTLLITMIVNMTILMIAITARLRTEQSHPAEDTAPRAAAALGGSGGGGTKARGDGQSFSYSDVKSAFLLVLWTPEVSWQLGREKGGGSPS